MLDEDQQIPPFLKLHIELHEQFEGFRTFTNFHELLLPKNRTEQPWFYVFSSLQQTKYIAKMVDRKGPVIIEISNFFHSFY
jgi:hypothetical protein